MTFTIITVIATILSLTGSILNAKQKISGFYIWIVANMIWIYVALYKEVYAQAFLMFVYSLVCLYGIIKWGRSE